MKKNQIDLAALGQRIRDRRAALHVTQEALADRMEISVDRLINIEAGLEEIELEELCTLVLVLNTSIDYILGQWPIVDRLTCVES